MRCDFDGRELPPDYVPEVDADGRPVQAVCGSCKDIQVHERSRRLGIVATDDLLDRFAAHLKLVIKPPLAQLSDDYVDCPSMGWKAKL